MVVLPKWFAKLKCICNGWIYDCSLMATTYSWKYMNSNCIITLYLKDKGNNKFCDLSFQCSLLLLSRCGRKYHLHTYIDSCMVLVSD